MNHAITITIDTDSLGNFTDSHLAALWHVAQANPAPHTDRDAGALAEKIGREIICRFLAVTRPELYAHQGEDYYWSTLVQHGSWPGPKHDTWIYDPNKAAAPAAQFTPPRIGADWPEQGGIYAGIVRGENDAPDHHLILLASEAESVNWSDAKQWAATTGGELPTRREQTLLYANLKDQFAGAWYWSSTQHASTSDYAWYQGFGYGAQNYYDTSNELRARAVRRLIIQ